MIQGIHHVSLKCEKEEYEMARRFYEDVLGLSVLKKCDECTLFDTGSGIVEIFCSGGGNAVTGAIRHVAFAVQDVDACAEAASAAGYTVFVGPKNVQVCGDPAFPARVAFCRGPLGEDIEFFCQGW